MSGERRNVYQAYFEGGCLPLWIWKDRWGPTRMLLRSVAEPKGPPPYYGNPRAVVEVWHFNGRTLERTPGDHPDPSLGTFNWSWASLGASDVGGFPAPEVSEEPA